jgi:hypothetical protein
LHRFCQHRGSGWSFKNHKDGNVHRENDDKSAKSMNFHGISMMIKHQIGRSSPKNHCWELPAETTPERKYVYPKKGWKK